MAQLVLELEHSFVRTPLEALAKSCRVSQKLCEKVRPHPGRGALLCACAPNPNL